MLKSLLPTVVAPTVAYFALHLLGVGDVPALCITAVFPLTATIATTVRTRRLDPIGALSTATIVIGIVAALLISDPRMLLEANVLPGLLVGVSLMVSAALGRPLLAVLVRRPVVATSLTYAWGAALTVAGLAHAALAWWAPTPVVVGFSPVITVIAILPALAWTMHVRRRAARLLVAA
jgi:hypothetical protein